MHLVRSILPGDLDVQVLRGGDMSASVHQASSCAPTKPRTSETIIETASEEDRSLSHADLRRLDAVEHPDWVAMVLSAVMSETQII